MLTNRNTLRLIINTRLLILCKEALFNLGALWSINILFNGTRENFISKVVFYVLASTLRTVAFRTIYISFKHRWFDISVLSLIYEKRLLEMFDDFKNK